MSAKVPPIRQDGLQVDEKRDFQERFWNLERVAWVGFAIVIVAALAGFTGGGGVFARQTVTVSGLAFDYPLVARRQAAETFKISLNQPAPTLVLSAAFSEAFQLERVQPRATAERAESDGLAIGFEGEPGGTVLLHARPQGPGLVSFAVTVGGETETVRLLVLP
jgi:hypothetical protein